MGAPRVASCPARLVSRSPSAASLFAAGYWRKTNFLKEMAAEGKDKAGEIDFYDSVSGAKLFTAPRGRTFEEFVKESDAHGWPSFRD